MTHRYVVIDETGNTSYDARGAQRPESFTSFAAAERRAKALAATSPGQIIGIYERKAHAYADVLPAVTTKVDR